MNVLRAIRALVLGETWFVPIGVAAIATVALVLDPLGGTAWRHAGGPALVAAAVVLLALSVARSARRR